MNIRSQSLDDHVLYYFQSDWNMDERSGNSIRSSFKLPHLKKYDYRHYGMTIPQYMRKMFQTIFLLLFELNTAPMMDSVFSVKLSGKSNDLRGLMDHHCFWTEYRKRVATLNGI